MRVSGRNFLACLLCVLVLAPAAAAQDGRDALSALVEAWMASPHADHRSPSFTHWNREGEVPLACAACHSQPGFIDFLGADGTGPAVVDAPAPVNATIGCASCHTRAAHALDAVAFPSGVVARELGASATCNVCHQGRSSGDAVATATSRIGEDDVAADLSFINPHYGIAAAVALGGEARGGYHYEGRSYSGRFAHVPSAASCVDCHEPHTAAVEPEPCLACHRAVGELSAIRMRHGDFDGDGDAAGGIAGEIAGLQARLLDAIRAYSAQAAGAPVAYSPDAFPYFFNDVDGDGTVGPDEATPANRYRSWTPRLLKAAYNYSFVAGDRGGYVHNPAYMLQLLHDSLESLAQRVEVDMTAMQRPR